MKRVPTVFKTCDGAMKRAAFERRHGYPAAYTEWWRYGRMTPDCAPYDPDALAQGKYFWRVALPSRFPVKNAP